MNKKYFIPAAIILIVIIIGLCYCIFKPCDHEWENATCNEPATCSICGETAGDPLGHNWAEATCTEPKTCLACGKTEGESLGHDWVEATYNAPKTCSICGETDGEPLEKPKSYGYIKLRDKNSFIKLYFKFNGAKYWTDDYVTIYYIEGCDMQKGE